MAILNPWVSSLKVWIVFCSSHDFLLKSILMDFLVNLVSKPDIYSLDISNMKMHLYFDGCNFQAW